MSEKKFVNFSLIVFALLAKSTKLLKLIKFFKVAKPVLLVVSMSISAIAYTFMMGPWLSILFVTLLLIHEMGHVVAMRMKGFETPTPVFIPFLGAAIFAPKFKNRHIEAFVGYGGPLLGTIGTLLVFGIWVLLPKDSSVAHIILVASYLSGYLNLFNMLPISPLDGGRILQAVGGWFKYIGFIGLAIVSILFRQPVILYVWIIVIFELTAIPLRLRTVLVTLFWIIMALLMLLGYGDQPKWVNVIDLWVTSIFPILCITKCFDHTIKDEVEDKRPELEAKLRLVWLALYLSLCATLLILLVILFPLLPKTK